MERQIFNLCQGWQFHPGFCKEDIYAASGAFEEICLPHTVREVPMNYVDEQSYQMHSCYRRVLKLDSALKNHRLFVDFEGVMTACTVYLNGKEVMFHRGGYTPFSVEITDYVKFDGRDLLVLDVDSTERKDTPPFGYVVDYLCFGGVYREVSLRAVPQAYISHVFARPEQVDATHPNLRLDVELKGCVHGSECRASVLDGGKMIAQAAVTVDAGSKDVTINLEQLEGIRLWSTEEPNLYEVQVELVSGEDRDRYDLRTGFRTACFTPDGFLLNGKKVELRGLNRHQQYPYVGYAMPRRAQYEDAEILKNELGINLVRTSHYPQSTHFLDCCDELGLLVLTELPGWQHIGNQDWQDQACADLRDMIRRDCNHPGIIMWGVRINESLDHHEFYVRTNEIAHRLDPTRQTGGIRCIENSEMLEDVYTYNDFTHNGGPEVLLDQKRVTGLDEYVPYLVTENNGHMYPTKQFDGEERKIEHALRHTRVMNAAGADPHICGMIGWCAFDYNTHKDFGSGDKICYHGVMDMFRIPKFAAAAYASQSEDHLVLEPATHWTLGDKCEGTVMPVTVFTNCDSVRLVANGVDMGLHLPEREAYPGLKYPPVVIRSMKMEWGRDMVDALFIGYKDGEAVMERRYCANPLPQRLALQASHTELSAGPWDTTRVVCRLVDAQGNPLHYAFEPVQFEVEGPASIIGPETVSLIGGQTGFWLRTNGESGRICIKAHTGSMDAEPIYVDVF